MREPWVEELLELGVGALAVDALYRLRDPYRFERVRVCPRCGYEPRKYAAECPYCRVPLVRERRRVEEDEVEGA